MKYLSLLLTFISFSSGALACDLELFDKVYKFNSNRPLQSKDVIVKSNCSHAVLVKVGQIISNAQGTIGNDFLEREILKETQIQTNITPAKTSIIELDSFLNDNLLKEETLVFTDLKSLQKQNSLGLKAEENLRVECDNCNSLGDKNVKLIISQAVEGTEFNQWIQVKLMAKIKALKAKRNISFQQKALNAEDFFLEEVLTTQPENLVTSFENINFYRATKLIMQNAALSHMDILPVNLVNYGTPVKVTLSNDSIQLEKILMPTRSARFNETVELNGPNNKKIIGKVIDFNKVVIEL